MPLNPNQGTGYVDWGNYVNANQPTIDADRKKVGDYLSGMDTQARDTVDTTPHMPDVPDLTNGNTAVQNAAKYANDVTKFNADSAKPSAYGNFKQSLTDAQGALASPSGFSQVKANADAGYDPNNTSGKGGTTEGYKKAQYDPWTSALEGQNAESLYGGADTLKPKDAPAAPASAPAPRTQTSAEPGWDPSSHEGPYMKPRSNPRNKKSGGD